MKKMKYLNKLKKDITFYKAAKIITRNRLKHIFDLSDKYLEEPTVQNLHRLRIAVRRMRFSFELFVNCYSKKTFRYTLKGLKKLQDAIGIIRDIDVVMVKLKELFNSSSVEIPDEIILNLYKNKNEMKEKISQELVKFKGDKIIQSLLN